MTIQRGLNGSPNLQRVHVQIGEVSKAGWFLHHMPYNKIMVYWGVTDGREQVGQVDANSVTFDAPPVVTDEPSPPDDFGYAP